MGCKRGRGVPRSGVVRGKALKNAITRTAARAYESRRVDVRFGAIVDEGLAPLVARGLFDAENGVWMA